MHKNLFRDLSKYLLTLTAHTDIIYLDIILNRSVVIDIGFPETFKALSDPVRRDILILLKNRSLSAGDIGRHFDMTGATISYHLSQLKKADLVFETKYKNYVFYELNASIFEELMLWLSQFHGGLNPCNEESTVP